MTRPSGASGSACPLCGARTRFRLRKNACDIVRCRSCCLEFVDPIPSDAELAAQYDDESWFDYTSVSRTAESARSENGEGGEGGGLPETSADRLPAAAIRATDELLKFAEHHLGRNGSILDVGCGNGPLLLCARDAGWDAHGLETSEWAVGFCREVLGLDVRRGVLEGNPFEGEKFDVITLIHSLEHMPRPVASLVEVRQLLAPGGLVHIGVPNLGSLGRRLLAREWRGYAPPSHLWYFDHANLAAALCRAGFDVVDAESRILVPSMWRDDPTGAVLQDDLATAAETGAGEPGRAKQLAKRVVRTPLQWMWLLDSVHIWAAAR